MRLTVLLSIIRSKDGVPGAFKCALKPLVRLQGVPADDMCRVLSECLLILLDFYYQDRPVCQPFCHRG